MADILLYFTGIAMILMYYFKETHSQPIEYYTPNDSTQLASHHFKEESAFKSSEEGAGLSSEEGADLSSEEGADLSSEEGADLSSDNTIFESNYSQSTPQNSTVTPDGRPPCNLLSDQSMSILEISNSRIDTSFTYCKNSQ